ncbi:septum formation family protein [Dactylosporangium salmoneum]|uniref:Septum formation-related domain-containing protein n=1 Tax=Dactylosporangium salmoneum TaxID=53361 RepID=A0ABN3I5P2_9ACTN
MNGKIAAGVAVALVAGCCGFALYRHFAPNHHASGDKGCVVDAAKAGQLQPGRCADSHQAEIVDFFYPDGAQDGCHKSAEEFLGGPLADSQVELSLLDYVREDYTSQACALFVVSDSEGTRAPHSGSLQGTMSGDRPMAATCGRYTDGVLTYVACTEPHAAEYVGSTVDGGEHEASCRQAAAAYLGLSAEEFAGRHDLQSHWLKTPRDGGRVGCVVVETSGKDVMTKSVKGLRTGPLPV